MLGFCAAAFARMPPTTDLFPPDACGTLKCEVDLFQNRESCWFFRGGWLRSA